MTAPSSPPSAEPSPLDGSHEGPVRITGPLRRLLVWLLPAYTVIFVVWGAVSGLLLAVQVGHHDEEHKVSNLAVVATIGAFCAIIAQPVAGVVSDRTRSRWGRRTPWLIGGTVAGGAALVALGFQTTLVGMTVCWSLVQVGYNFAQGPLSAVMPDRVPRLARGTFAAVTGLGTMVGLLGGQFVGAGFRHAIPFGYTALAVVTIAVVVAFCLANREPSSSDLPRDRFSARDFLLGFWVSPVRHPDFFWAFTGRLLLTTGYTFITGYQVYILSDYVGLGLEEAAATAPVLAGTVLVPLVLVTVVAGPLSDRFDRRRLFVFVGGLVLAVALVIPWAWPNLGGMFAFAAVAGTGLGLFQSVDTALMSEVLPSKDTFAKDLGLINIAAALPQTIAPGIAGAIVLGFGYGGLFPVGIVLCVCGAFAVWPIRSVR